VLDGQFGCVLKQHVLSKLLDQSHPTIRMTQHACQESSDTDEDDGAPALPPPSWASELVASARANAGESVYPPSDDTYLVLEALHADAVKLQKLQPRICLEVGTGTGVLSIGLGLVLQMLGVSMPVFVAVDKNPDATLVTAALFQQSGDAACSQQHRADILGGWLAVAWLSRRRDLQPTVCCHTSRGDAWLWH